MAAYLTLNFSSPYSNMPEPVTGLVFSAISAGANGLQAVHYGKKILKTVPTGTVFKTEDAVLKDLEKRLTNIRKLLLECMPALNYGVDTISESSTESQYPTSSVPEPVNSSTAAADDEGERILRVLYRSYLDCEVRYSNLTGQKLGSAPPKRRSGFRAIFSVFAKISKELKELQDSITQVETRAKVVSAAAIAQKERSRLESDVQISRDMQAELKERRPQLKLLSPAEQRSEVTAVAMKYVGEVDARVFATEYCKKLRDGSTPPTQPATPESTESSTTTNTTTTSSGGVTDAQEIELANLAKRPRTDPMEGSNPNPFADPVNSPQETTRGTS